MVNFVKISWRNLWRNWRRTIIAFSAIALGLTFLVFMDGIVGGSRVAIYGNLIRLLGGNVQAHAPGYAEKASRLPLTAVPDAEKVIQTALKRAEVVGASGRINTGGFVSAREGSLPVHILGIEPEKEAALSLVAGNIIVGRYLQSADKDVILVGKTLAERLGVGLGERVSLIGRAPHEQMRTRAMTIIGIYAIGSAELEKTNVYIALGEAQMLYDLPGQVTEVVIALDTVGNEAATVTALRAALPGVELASWKELNPALVTTYELGDQMISIFGMIVLLIAGIGILNLMLMAVFERTREIGLLAAIGMKRRQIVGLFMLEGTLIGALGAIAGMILGGAIVLALGRVGWDLGATNEAGQATALMGSVLYPVLELSPLLTRAVTVLVIAALASLYPAWRAGSSQPAEALHYV